MNLKKYQPIDSETLGQYLKRLRKLASHVQNKSVTLNQLADLSRRPPAISQEQFTNGWLSMVESDSYDNIGGDKLRNLATIYSELLHTTIPAEWLLAKAGFQLSVDSMLQDNKQKLEKFLAHNDILALVGICGRLVELGYDDDVRLLVQFAQRYLQAHNPNAQTTDLFDDPALSAHIRKYMEALGL